MDDSSSKVVQMAQIESFGNYHPEQIEDDQTLRDDWSVLATLWAHCLEGKATPWSRDLILVNAIRVATVLCRRDAIVFHPQAVEPGVRDLYDRVKAELDARRVPVPHALTAEELEAVKPPFKSLSDQQLLLLHNNLHDTWGDGDLNREDVWNAHKLVVEELGRRDLEHVGTESKLDQPLTETEAEVSRVTLKELKEVLLPNRFVPIVVTHDVLSLAGSACYGIEPNDYDWVVRGGGGLPISLIKQALDDFLPQADNHVFDDPLGPNWDYIPLGDLVAWSAGAELPETKVGQVPESFEWLKGLPAFHVRRRWLGLAPGGKSLLIVGRVSGGGILKLERIWHDKPVVIASVPVLPSDAVSVADLVFVPYPKVELVQLAEPKFRQHALAFWKSPARIQYAPIVETPNLVEGKLVEGKYSRARCMRCRKLPVIDVQWADGRARAWFCLSCFEKWAHKEEDREIVRAWFVKTGEVPKKIGQGDGDQILKLGSKLNTQELIKRLKKLASGAALAEADAGKMKIEPLIPFTPMKASKAYRVGEFHDTKAIWEFWARAYIEAGRPLIAEIKYDGLRLSLHRKGQKVAIYTEDKKRDRAAVLPEVVKELLALPCDSVILDTEAVIWETGRPIPRREMMSLIVGKKPFVEEDVHFNIHDLLYLDGESLLDVPYVERLKALEKLLPRDGKHLRKVPYRTIGSREEFDAALEWASTQPGSEGSMVKSADSLYDVISTTPRSLDWAKYKIVREVKVQVIGHLRKPLPWASLGRKPPTKPLSGEEAHSWYKKLAQKSETYLYRGAVSAESKLHPIEANSTLTPADLNLRWVVPGTEDPLTGKMVSGERGSWRGTNDPHLWEMGLGFEDREHGDLAYGVTYAAKLKAKIGDIVTVTPVLMRRWQTEDKQIHVSWTFPILRNLDPERTKPDTLADIERIVKQSRSRLEPKILEETWRSPPIGSAGGKYYLAPTIVALLPPHEVYVEPYAGSCAVLFAKPRAETEVISDADTQLARALRDIQEATLEDMHTLRGMDWQPSKQKFDRFRDGKPPAGHLDRLHRYLYLNWFGFGSKTTTYRGYPIHWNLDARLERVDQARHRLQRVKVYSQDALKVIKKWDSAHSVFYLDPPYPGSDSGKAWPDYTIEDFTALVKVLRGLKGKFILSISDTPEYRKLLSGFQIKALTRAHLLPRGSAFDGGKLARTRKELLVANFPLPKTSLKKLSWPSMREVAEGQQVSLDLGPSPIDSPALAYLAINGCVPPRLLWGCVEHLTRPWRDEQVDVHLEDEWLEALVDIEGIEVESSCEGHKDGDLTQPAFLAFHLVPGRSVEAEEVAHRLHKPPQAYGTYSRVGEGAESRPRIVVASSTIYGDAEFEAFWQGLPVRIGEALDAASLVAGEPIEKDEERLPSAKPKTREEKRAEAEKILGDSYMVEQPPGKTFPSAIQYHLRGIYSPDQLVQIRKDLKAAGNQEELDEAWKKWKDLAWLKAPFEQVRKAAQAADDERGDVTKAIHQLVETGPPPFGRLASLYSRIGNIGSAHIDWRQVDPSMRYLSCSWTCDVRKSVFQTVEDELLWFLRDRIMENQPGDQWLCQKKCPGSIDADEDLLLPWLLQQEMVVKEACRLLADWRPGLFLSAAEGLCSAETLWESVQPLVWLTIVGPRKPVLDVPPGEIGATVASAGRFIWVANLEMAYGTRKSDFHEGFFFWKAHNRALFPKLDYSKLDGRWDVKFIEPDKPYKKAGEEFWMGNHPWAEKGQLPYVLTHDLATETKKAKQDKIEMVWGDSVIPILQRLKYKPVTDFLKGE